MPNLSFVGLAKIFSFNNYQYEVFYAIQALPDGFVLFSFSQIFILIIF
jgi:hypothetical protein